MSSSASFTGAEITYSPLAHLPKSMMRQRSLQNGKSGSVPFTTFLQMGHPSFAVRFRGMGLNYCRTRVVDEKVSGR